MIVEGAPAEFSCGKLDAVLHVRKLFQLIADHTESAVLPQQVCWVAGSDTTRVSTRDLIDYLDRCDFPSVVMCQRADEQYYQVSDDLITFNPGSLLDYIEPLGLAWVPRHGAMLQKDMPEGILKGTPDPVSAAAFPYVTDRIEAMRKAAALFWVDYDKQRPPLQKTVSSFIAEQLGMDAPNRTTDTLAAAIRPADAPNER